MHNFFSRFSFVNRKSSIVNRQSSRPAAAVAFFFAAGIAASPFCRVYSFCTLAAAGTLLACASFLALRRNRVALSLVAGLVAIGISGFLMALAHRDGFSDYDVRYLLARQAFPLNEPMSFDGCVVEDSARHGEDSVVTVDLNAFLQGGRWVHCAGKGILRVAKPGSDGPTEQAADPIRGDRIRGWAVWQVPRNYENPGSSDRAGLLRDEGSLYSAEQNPSAYWKRYPAAAPIHGQSWRRQHGRMCKGVLIPLRKSKTGSRQQCWQVSLSGTIPASITPHERHSRIPEPIMFWLFRVCMWHGLRGYSFIFSNGSVCRIVFAILWSPS